MRIKKFMPQKRLLP